MWVSPLNKTHPRRLCEFRSRGGCEFWIRRGHGGFRGGDRGLVVSPGWHAVGVRRVSLGVVGISRGILSLGILSPRISRWILSLGIPRLILTRTVRASVLCVILGGDFHDQASAVHRSAVQFADYTIHDGRVGESDEREPATRACCSVKHHVAANDTLAKT